jgi:uncharacterized protein
MWALLLLGLLAPPAAPPRPVEADARPRLIAVAARGDAAEVAALLRAGADPDSADRSGWTALHQAAETGDAAVARLLLDSGATPDLRSRDRGTALDVAEREGWTELARLLRAHGARGSGKSIGDTVCVRPWRGDGYCGVVEAVAGTRFHLRVTRVAGCSDGCAADALCSAARPVGGASGLGAGDRLWVPASCLTHTGVR